MAGPKDQMDRGEIEDRFTSASRGDKIRVVANNETYIGEVTHASTNVRDGGKASVTIETEDGNYINVEAPINPPEPDVGIRNPYFEEISLEGYLVDALQLWSEAYDDWL